MRKTGQSFGERIRQARKLRGMSTAELASALNISETTLRTWETSEVELPIETTKKIVGALDVSVSYLLGESDNPELKSIQRTEPQSAPPFAERRKERLWLRDQPLRPPDAGAPPADPDHPVIRDELRATLQRSGATREDLEAFAGSLRDLLAQVEAMIKE